MSKERSSNGASKKIFFAWPTREVSYAVGAAFLSGYVTYFATDFMDISPAMVGIIFMISKIFDGFTDIVAGYIIDRTDTKYGKGRPYDLAIIGYWLFIVLIFCAPELGLAPSCIYLFVMYSMVNAVFLTLMQCAGPVYLANSIDNTQQSVGISAFTGFISLIFTMVASMILPGIVQSLGTTRAGWAKISIMLAIPFTFIGVIRFFVVKEKKAVVEAKVEKITIKKMIVLLSQNKYILIFSLIILISNIGSNMVNNVTTYFYLYIMEDLQLAGVMSLSMLAIIIVIVLTPFLSKKFGFTNVMRATTLIGAFGYLIRLFAIHNIPLLFVTNMVSMMGFYTMFSFGGTFVLECIDYGEWKTGVRSEGTIACAQSVTSKIGTAVGVGLVGVLMGISGYQGSEVVQSEGSRNMIIALFSIVPAVFCIIQFVLLKVYDLDKLLPQINKDLEERRSKKNSFE